MRKIPRIKGQITDLYRRGRNLVIKLNNTFIRQLVVRNGNDVKISHKRGFIIIKARNNDGKRIIRDLYEILKRAGVAVHRRGDALIIED